MVATMVHLCGQRVVPAESLEMPETRPFVTLLYTDLPS